MSDGKRCLKCDGRNNMYYNGANMNWNTEIQTASWFCAYCEIKMIATYKEISFKTCEEQI